MIQGDHDWEANLSRTTRPTLPLVPVHLGLQFDVYAGWFLISVGEKRKFVLMVEPFCELIQKGRVCNWRLKKPWKYALRVCTV